MKIHNAHAEKVCLVGMGEKQCRYWSRNLRDKTNFCLKLDNSKLVDDEVNTIKTSKFEGLFNILQIPIGDNCPGI